MKGKNGILVKAIVVVLIFVIWLVSARVIYIRVLQASVVDPTVVAAYQPYLNIGLVKKSADFLEEKSAGLEFSSMDDGL